MKVTVWGINYAPESIGIAPYNRDLCEYLSGRGHEVRMVTTFPYYPSWRKEPGDRRCWTRTETAMGVRVSRCWCYVPKVATTLKRIAHELSFGMASTLRVLSLPRADVYLVISPPLALGFFAWIATLIKRSRFIFHVQDLQPDAAVGLGMVRGGWLIRSLYVLERLAYDKAAVVSGISGGMMAAIAGKGVPRGKRILLPNWLRPPAVSTSSCQTRSETRRGLGVGDATLLAVYSGNLGRKQNLGILVEAAALLPARTPDAASKVALVIAGDGAARPELEERLRSSPGVPIRLLPLLNDTAYAALLRAADLALITQAAGTGQFFFPSKLISVLEAGLPVIAVADETSELARAVHSGGFGRVIRPDDPAGLADALRNLGECRAQLEVWAARTVWVRQFCGESILGRFEELLLSWTPEICAEAPAVASRQARSVAEPVASAS